MEFALVLILVLLFYYFGKYTVFHIFLNLLMYLFYVWLWLLILIPKDETQIVRGDNGLGFVFLTIVTVPIYLLINTISMYYYRKVNQMRIAKIHAIGFVLCVLHILFSIYMIFLN